MRLRSALLCACLDAVSAQPYAAPKAPLSAFVQEDKYSNPHLSPDGKYVAVTVRVPNGAGPFAQIVTIFSLPDMKIAGALRMPIYDAPKGYIWAGNTRLVIVRTKHSDVVATEFDGSKQEYLYGPQTATSARRGDRYGNDYDSAYLTTFVQAPDNHFLLATQPADRQQTFLFDVNSINATRTKLADVPAQGMWFLVQGDGKPRIAFGVDENTPPAVYRYNQASDKWEPHSGKFGKHYKPLEFSADATEFAALYSPEGGPDQLIKENLATGARTILLADPRGNVDSALYGATHGLPFAAGSSIGIPALTYFDPAGEDAKLHKLLNAQFPGSAVSFVDFARDGKTLLFRVASDRDPGAYFALYRDTMKADLLFTVREAIVPEDMAERRPIAFKARDGLGLHGYLTLPRHASGARLPMVVLPHDGPAGTVDTWLFDRDAQFLASRGYAVLQVNFRGSGGRGIDFENAGHRQWGGKIQDDLVDGVKWAIAQGGVDGARVCAYGAGFGGYSALMLAAREPALFKCAVGYGGFYDLGLLYKTDDLRRERKPAELYGKQLGHDEAELARFSPLAQAGRITSPVLLVHGGEDATASIAHATAMRAALTKAGRAPEWLTASDEEHGFTDPANVAQFYQKLEAFLGKHIGEQD